MPETARAAEPAGQGFAVEARDLTRTVGDGTPILSGVSIDIAPGELVAVVGGSGAGKTTLLDALAGLSSVDRGVVRYDGVSIREHLDALRTLRAYVPQDDIIPTELPLARTLRYAAMLRLPSGTTWAAAGDAAGRAIETLGLSRRRDTVVARLSGGERKRASIAVELLTDPRVFFLDEPTSGLDPATSAELLRVLRRLAASGATVVFTTHAVQDLATCDRVAFLASGGRLAFFGRVEDALRAFDAPSVEAVYERLDGSTVRAADTPPGPSTTPPQRAGVPGPVPRRPGAARQWGILTARTLETIVRNRLTLAILLGAPAMVVAMIAILFRPGAFSPAHPQPSSIVMILFWLTFGAFFFGLTYGLLQIVTERAVVRREHAVGMRLSSYLLSKVAVLLPFLLVVNAIMVTVLRAADRLPPGSTLTWVRVTGTLTLLALAALALGLLTSAAVSSSSQATLALPMLCFPAVLFSGAIVPVHLMAGVGAAIAAIVPVRWAFEGIGHDLGVRGLLAHGHSSLGPPLLRTYGGAGTHAASSYEAVLAVFALVFLAAGWAVLRRSVGRPTR